MRINADSVRETHIFTFFCLNQLTFWHFICLVGMSRKIYIADDETNIRFAIKTFLENAGYIVADFETGDLLLATFTETKPDMVILDVMMPGSNGFVICKEIRKTSNIPVIMLTARDSDLDYATGLDLGSDDYLVKPFSPMALVMRVKALFRRIELERKFYTEHGTNDKDMK